MQSTSYIGTQPFQTGLPYHGGFCQWWFTPWQHIQQWPSINPLTQQAANAPTLKPNTTWYGPIQVPNTLLTFSQQLETVAAGKFYKNTLEGIIPGTDATEDANLANLAHNEVVVIGKRRAGGQFVLLGTPNVGMSFNYKTDTGSWQDFAQTKFNLSIQTYQKPPIITTFSGQPNTPPAGAIIPQPNPNPGGTRPMETIYFTNQSIVSIPWTASRLSAYGTFPLIEVWITENGISQQTSVPITVDSPPPSTGTFTINLSGTATGFIIIK